MHTHRKRIQMIGDLAPSTSSGTWSRDWGGTIAYTMGSKDTLEGLAARYMGGVRNAGALAALQPKESQARGFGPGSVLRMPKEAADRATALGFVREYESPNQQNQRYESLGGGGRWVGGIGAINLTLLPSDVELAMAQTDADVESVARTANQASVPANTRAAFGTFYSGWKSFLASERPVSILPMRYLDTYHKTVDYRLQARKWEGDLRDHGVPQVGPSIQPDGPDANGGGLAGLSSTVKWVAGGAALLALAYMFGPLLRSAAPRRRSAA